MPTSKKDNDRDIFWQVLSRMPKENLIALAERYDAMPPKLKGRITRRQIAESLLSKIPLDLIGDFRCNSKISTPLKKLRQRQQAENIRHYPQKKSSETEKFQFKYQLEQIIVESPLLFQQTLNSLVNFLLSLEVSCFDDTLALIYDPNIPASDRGNLCWFLSRLDRQLSEAELIKILDLPHPELRRAAAFELGNFNSNRASKRLLLALEDCDERVVNCAIYSLSKLKVPEVIPKSIEILKNPNTSQFLKITAAKILAKSDDKKAIYTLKSLLAPHSPRLNYWLLDSIEKILKRV